MDSIDYMEAKYKFVGVRKHFFKDVPYFITVFDDMVTMGIVKIENIYYRPPIARIRNIN